MPTYLVTDPQTGRKLRLTGDSPPTEQELEGIFSQFEQPAQPAAPQQEKAPSLLSRLLPGATGFGESIAKAIITPQVQKQVDDSNATQDFVNQAALRKLKEAQAAGNTEAVAKLTEILKKSGMAPSQGVDDIIGPLPTTKQVIGQAVQLGAETLGGMKGAGTLAGRVGQGAALGATAGAGDALENDRNALSGAMFGAVTGAAIPAALEGGSAAVKKLLKGSAESIYNGIVKTPSRQLAAGREPIGKGLLDRKIAGSEPAIIAKLEELKTANLSTVDDLVKRNADMSVDISGTFKALDDMRGKLDAAGSGTSGIDNVIAAIQRKAKNGKISLSEAQKLKRALDDAVNIGFDNPNLSGVRSAQKKAANQIRASIAKAVPEIAEANKEVSFSIRALDELNKQQEGSVALRNMLGSIMGGLRSGAAGTVGAMTGGIPGAVAGVALDKFVVSNPAVTTRAAQTANRAASAQLPTTLRDLLQRAGVLSASRSMNQ